MDNQGGSVRRNIALKLRGDQATAQRVQHPELKKGWCGEHISTMWFFSIDARTPNRILMDIQMKFSARINPSSARTSVISAYFGEKL